MPLNLSIDKTITQIYLDPVSNEEIWGSVVEQREKKPKGVAGSRMWACHLFTETQKIPKKKSLHCPPLFAALQTPATGGGGWEGWGMEGVGVRGGSGELTRGKG